MGRDYPEEATQEGARAVAGWPALGHLAGLTPGLRAANVTGRGLSVFTGCCKL